METAPSPAPTEFSFARFVPSDQPLSIDMVRYFKEEMRYVMQKMLAPHLEDGRTWVVKHEWEEQPDREMMMRGTRLTLRARLLLLKSEEAAVGEWLHPKSLPAVGDALRFMSPNGQAFRRQYASGPWERIL